VEPEGSLPHLQEPATCPYPEPYNNNNNKKKKKKTKKKK
jgi:hypothetical protein